MGSVVAPYDYDGRFPTFGFGGKPHHMGISAVSHCFAINGVASNPEIEGVEKIVQVYKESL